MKSTLLLAAFLIPGAAALVASQDPPPARPPGFAVVDLPKCFAKDRNEAIQDVDQELQKMAEQIARKLRDAEGSDPKEILKLREKLKAEYLAFYNRKKAEIYHEVQSVTQILGKERGYTLVLKKDSSPLDGDEAETALIGQRGVLYNDPAIDITDEVLKRMNAAYAAKKGKKDKNF